MGIEVEVGAGGGGVTGSWGLRQCWKKIVSIVLNEHKYDAIS